MSKGDGGGRRDVASNAGAEVPLSEQEYKVIFEKSTIGYSLTAPDGRVLLANEAFARMLGYSRDELMCLGFADITHPDDLAQSHECVRSLLQGECDTYRLEKRYLHRDGGFVWTLVTTTLHRAEDGTPLFFITNIQDIGDLKGAEAALKESEERFRRITDTIADVAFSCVRHPDGTFDFDWVTGDTVAVLGYTVEELKESAGGWISLVIDQDRPRLKRTTTELMPGEQVAAEVRLRRPDGQTAWVSWYAQCTAQEDCGVRIYGGLVDVTAARRLQMEHQLLADTLAASLNEIYIFDAETLLFREVNRGALQNLGYPTRVIRQMTPLDIKPEFTQESFAELVRPLLAGDKDMQVFETVHQRADGSTYPVEVHLQLLEHDAQRVFLAVIQDITERRQAQAAEARNEARLRSLVSILQQEVQSTRELLDLALEEAIRLTESMYGFICARDEHSDDFVMNAWSKEVMPACRVTEIPARFKLEEAGIWGEPARRRQPIILNDYAEPHPLKHGFPEGHVAVSRFLAIPVMMAERVTAVVGVANKTDPYDDSDVLQLTLLMDSVWRAVERRRMQDELWKVTAAVEQSPALVEITDLQGNIEYVNHRFEETTGYSLAEVRGKNPRILKSGETPTEVYQEMWRTITSGGEWRGELHNRRKDGTLYWERAAISPLRTGDGATTHYLAVKEDITAQKELENQVRQAQKMEAVGRLAGGVAHDFNNMLSVILGHAEIAMEEAEHDSPLRADLEEIQKAAQRSAELTRQLLGFARSQAIKPVVLDLNEAVPRALNMLRRLIGEDIDLLWKPGLDVWSVRIDPAQLDQILANLAVNARDAIEGVGCLTIETSNALIDQAYCVTHAGFTPGRFVQLAVSDNGYGMDRSVLEHVFEPFFTTKGAGVGTGLGLATVHGIVRQNNGFINVYSEPGCGTTFKIYLPQVASASSTGAGAAEPPLVGGTETVLVVEDEETILDLARVILERCGYHVLTARGPAAALETAADPARTIDLLITDVVMPAMNGRELAAQMVGLQPQMKALFMSGYTANVIAHHGVLKPGVEFLQKPFTVAGLARKVREVLDRPRES